MWDHSIFSQHSESEGTANKWLFLELPVQKLKSTWNIKENFKNLKKFKKNWNICTNAKDRLVTWEHIISS
ncbi:hypothetical protein KFK09_021405 [Dendrobium nobile]|uniref:Uncharacterized protein n=1 Tax=Dendrobium nobile TaxID=94219 RepID=A0A8T3AQA6_DENNO|nr:hypothetical protein KFK09_021405 [Dendrobium nobile]